MTGLRIDPFGDNGKKFKIDSLALLTTGGDLAINKPVPTNILWRDVVVSDRKTTYTVDERRANHSEGEIFYVPAANSGLSGLKTLTRFYDSTAPTDYRDSTSSSLSGYSPDTIIGYTWPSIHTGTVAIREATSPSTQDTATTNAVIDSLLDGTHDYTLDMVNNGYAYPRYNIDYSGVALTSLTAGGITVKSNAVAGGCVWEWTWNGFQFINDEDYGREMQSSCFFPYNYNGNTKETNPTEAGSGIAGAANGNYAMGLYGAETSSGGSVVDYAIWNFTSLSGTGQFDGGSTKLDLVWRQSPLPAGDNVFTTYIVTGTLNDVTTAMHTLYTMRTSIPK